MKKRDYLDLRGRLRGGSFSGVEEPIKQQRLRDYEERFNDWMGKQGVMFQLRYSGMVGERSWSKQIGSLVVRFLILAFLGLGLGYGVLLWYYSSDGHHTKLMESFRESLGGEGSEVGVVKRSRASMTCRRVAIEGGEGSFFERAEFDGMTAPVGFLDGVFEEWKPQEVQVDRAVVQLKAGGKAEEMELALAGIVESLEGNGVKSIRVVDLTLEWGYSQLTYGEIRGTKMVANLEQGEWKVKLEGGTYSQNWLKGLAIGVGELVVGESGVVVKSLKLGVGGGGLVLSGTVGGSAGMPEFDLGGDFQALPLVDFLTLEDVTTRRFFEGKFSGKMKILGSPNRRVAMEGEVLLGEGDELILREGWGLLRMLSVVDRDRSYRRVNFTKGGFSFRSEGGGLVLTEIDLEAVEMARLRGEVTTRLPSQREAAESLGIALTEGFSSDDTDTSSARKLEDERMSLAEVRKGEAANDGSMGIGSSLSERGRAGDLSRSDLESVRLRSEMRRHRYEGELEFGVLESAFEKEERLDSLFPVDGEGWRWMKMEVNSTFSGIGVAAADLLMRESGNTESRRD